MMKNENDNSNDVLEGQVIVARPTPVARIGPIEYQGMQA